MISNKTHLEKRKKKEKLVLKIIFNSQCFQQHFRHPGQTIIDQSIKFPITSFIYDKKKVEVVNKIPP